MDITLKIIRGIFFAIIGIALLIYVLYVVGLKANSNPVGKIEDLYKVQAKVISKNVDKTVQEHIN